MFVIASKVQAASFRVWAVRRQANLFFPAQSGKKRVLLSMIISAACANFPGAENPLGFGYASRQDAKDAKFGNQFLFFAPFVFFAGDIPRPTGARSAPYGTLRVLRAFVVNPTFLILVAALPRCELRGERNQGDYARLPTQNLKSLLS